MPMFEFIMSSYSHSIKNNVTFFAIASKILVTEKSLGIAAEKL
jgi:hypothetical protein